MSDDLSPAHPDDRPLSQHEVRNLRFAETLPLALVGILERRYLTDFQPLQWRIEARAGDTARPLLLRVAGIGRPRQPGEWALAMPHVLTACHDPGHSLVMAMHGDGHHHALYLGARRILGAGGGDTAAFLDGLESAFRAHFTGLQLERAGSGQGPGPDAWSEAAELAAFLRTAPAMAVITGVPSRREERAGAGFQSLDRLVRAVGNHRYALIVAAEPLEQWVIDATLDACRRLKGEIHSYTRRTKSKTLGTTEGEARTEREQDTSLTGQLPYILMGVSAFCQLANLFPGHVASAAVHGLAGLSSGLAPGLQSAGMLAYYRSAQETAANTRQFSTSRSWSESGGCELLDANAEACERLLDQHIQRLQSGRSGGCWRTAIYAAGESEAALQSVVGAVRSLCSGSASALDPMRAISLPPRILREAIERGQVLGLRPGAGGAGHPLGESFDTLGTCLTSEELSVITTLPQQEIPGLRMRDLSDFALSSPAETTDGIVLGTLQDALGRDLDPVSITRTELNRHVFVTGMPGYGKTNTCMHLLLEAYRELGVPFLVIEPAKAEYRRLAQELRGKLRVYTVGGDSLLPFRLNPFCPARRDVPIRRHIDLLKAVFNASFPMYAGMPYVLEDAILEVYRERGWRLSGGEDLAPNVFLGPRSSEADRSALLPRLEDLYEKIEDVLKEKNYGQEIHRNMGAALRSRLGSLMRGTKGATLNSYRSVDMSDLFDGPTVIELKDLTDDDEKAFVMALLLVLLYEYGEMRRRDRAHADRERLQHLTLIEEAHRLLQATRGPASAEEGNPRHKAVAMFTDLLAEMRAYGEGFIIADQIPTKLAPEILKNTNLKIVHRLVAPEDKQVTGSCINLNEWQVKHLNNLYPGMAIVHSERIGEAIQVRVHEVKDSRARDLPDAELRSVLAESRGEFDLIYMQRHAGCAACPSPGSFYRHLEDAGERESVDQALEPFLEALLLDDAHAAWETWSRWRSDWRAAGQALRGLDPETADGVTYCAAAQATHDWLGRLLADRARLADPSGHLSGPDRLLREQAAEGMAELLRTWTESDQLDERGASLFSKTVASLRGRLGNGAGGCATCSGASGACPMLPWVAPHLQSLMVPFSREMLTSDSPEQRLKAILKSVAGVQAKIAMLGRRPDAAGARRQWLRCALSHVEFSGASGKRRDELLDLLHSFPRERETSAS